MPSYIDRIRSVYGPSTERLYYFHRIQKGKAAATGRTEKSKGVEIKEKEKAYLDKNKNVASLLFLSFGDFQRLVACLLFPNNDPLLNSPWSGGKD